MTKNANFVFFDCKSEQKEVEKGEDLAQSETARLNRMYPRFIREIHPFFSPFFCKLAATPMGTYVGLLPTEIVMK